MSRLFDRLDSGQLAVGTYAVMHGPEYIELIGHCGLDYVIIDMMVTGLSWTEVAQAIRAAEHFNVTPFVRLQAYPWSERDDVDPGLAADVLRAQSLGAEGVLASVNTAQQVAALVRPSGDHHYRAWISGPGGDDPYRKPSNPNATAREAQAELESMWRAKRILAPALETKRSLDHLEEILAIPDLRAVHLAMSDLTVELEVPGQYTHPVMQEMVKRTASLAKERNQLVIVNVGMPRDSNGLDRLAESAIWMWENGVQAILVPHPAFAIQWFYERTRLAFDANGLLAKAWPAVPTQGPRANGSQGATQLKEGSVVE
jgi:2-keto-3-deoxy-L-rhamnonate aldolase RhmA